MRYLPVKQLSLGGLLTDISYKSFHSKKKKKKNDLGFLALAGEMVVKSLSVRNKQPEFNS